MRLLFLTLCVLLSIFLICEAQRNVRTGQRYAFGEDTSEGQYSKFNGPVRGLPAGHGGGKWGKLNKNFNWPVSENAALTQILSLSVRGVLQSDYIVNNETFCKIIVQSTPKNSIIIILNTIIVFSILF